MNAVPLSNPVESGKAAMLSLVVIHLFRLCLMLGLLQGKG